MATKIYTESGVFDVNDLYENVLKKMDEIKEPPFVFQAMLEEGDRRVTIVAQYIVAVEEGY